jgi:hypothetical protein
MSIKKNIISIKEFNKVKEYKIDFIDWSSYSIKVRAESEEHAESFALSLKDTKELSNMQPTDRLFEVAYIEEKK